MSKKLFNLFLVVMMLCFVALTPAVVTAGGAGSLYGHATGEETQIHVVAGADEEVDSGTIGTDNRILGFTVIGYGAASFAGLYDDTALETTTAANCIGEGGGISGEAYTIWFPFPVDLDNGLVVIVDAATTYVTIYYE